MEIQYKGINIPKEIIIVEKQAYEDGKTPQGFVVPKGKDNILKTAMNWAHWTKSNWSYDKEKRCRVQDAPNEDKPGIQHTYKNGTFKIKLYDSANGSSQGGKLSFWDCTIIAEDGKEFIIGINQDLLLNILLNSIVINGEVQGNVWLGREKNSTGVYTPEMEDFKQAQKDEEIRNIKLSSNYQPGQVLSSKSDYDCTYLGTVWKYFDIEDDYWREINIKIFKKPIKAHVYYSKDGYQKYSIKNSKVKRIITNKTEDISLETGWQNIYDKSHTYDNSNTGYRRDKIKGSLFDLQYSLDLKNKPTWVLEERLKELYKNKDFSDVNINITIE